VSGQYPFKRLASELIAHGVDSEYIARVEARVSREQQLETLQTL
jgi:SOS response regulatory protein OraA/RecX